MANQQASLAAQSLSGALHARCAGAARMRLASSTLVAGAVAAGSMVCAAWIDPVIDTPAWARMLSGVLVICVIAMLLGRGVRAMIARADLVLAAVRVDEARGDRGRSVEIAAELIEHAGHTRANDVLVARAMTRAVECIERLAIEGAHPLSREARGLRWSAAAVVATSAALLLSAIAGDARLSTAWSRWRSPFADLPPYSAVSLVAHVSGADAQNALVEVFVRGGEVDDVRLEVHAGPHRGTPALVATQQSGTDEGASIYRATLRDVTTSISVRAVSNRGRSPWVEHEPLRAPRLRMATLTLIPPAYDPRPAATAPLVEGQITTREAIEGGRFEVLILATARVPASDATVEGVDAEVVSNGSGMVIRGKADPAGEIVVKIDPLKLACRIVVRHDRAPDVRWLEGQGDSGTAWSDGLSHEASDDVGIERSTLLYSLVQARGKWLASGAVELERYEPSRESVRHQSAASVEEILQEVGVAARAGDLIVFSVAAAERGRMDALAARTAVTSIRQHRVVDSAERVDPGMIEGDVSARQEDLAGGDADADVAASDSSPSSSRGRASEGAERVLSAVATALGAASGGRGREQTISLLDRTTAGSEGVELEQQAEVGSGITGPQEGQRESGELSGSETERGREQDAAGDEPDVRRLDPRNTASDTVIPRRSIEHREMEGVPSSIGPMDRELVRAYYERLRGRRDRIVPNHAPRPEKGAE